MMRQQGSLFLVYGQGTRPRAVRQQQFLHQYIYGAVCPEERKGAALIGGHANSQMMSLHLEEISAHISKGKHGVVVMDQAGWHRSRELRKPKNISILHLPPLSILHLPPYSPELNPQENVWEVMKDRSLKNRVYKSLEDITETACDAWKQWIANKDKIQSTCRREWAKLG